jgi:hypothetical protein
MQKGGRQGAENSLFVAEAADGIDPGGPVGGGATSDLPRTEPRHRSTENSGAASPGALTRDGVRTQSAGHFPRPPDVTWYSGTVNTLG